MSVILKIFILTLLILILSVTNVYCVLEPYKWMYFKPYGSTVNLEPLFNNTQCLIQSKCYWLLPDKRTHLNYPLNASSTSKYSISSDGILTIVDIQASDNGIYHFFKMNNSEWIVSKALLNLHGAPFDSLWLEYWPNVVGGLVAMAAVLIGFGLILLADKYRYRSPSHTSTRGSSNRPGTVEPTVVERANPIFINDDNDTITSRKHVHSRRTSSNSNATGLRIEQF